MRMGSSATPAGDEKAMPKKVTPLKLKHLSAHPAIDAQLFVRFCVLSIGAW